MYSVSAACIVKSLLNLSVTKTTTEKRRLINFISTVWANFSLREFCFAGRGETPGWFPVARYDWFAQNTEADMVSGKK